jgi:RHS repeat-associated protein
VRQGFTGYETDVETGLDFAEARMYSSQLGRFSGADPVGGLLENPQSLNKFAYAWNNPLLLTDPTGLKVSWEDSEKEKKKGEDEAKTNGQRAYEKRLKEMIDSKDKKTHEKGLKLMATYEKLRKSDVTFHVVKDDGNGNSKGELTYKGEKGHLYINLDGNSNEYGALPLIQKIAHEFKHGEQFLDGQLGFAQDEKGKWRGYRDDNFDEAEAWSAGFDAQFPGPDQRSGTAGKFVESVVRAYSSGIPAIAKALDESNGTYRGRGTSQFPISNLTPTIYAIPKKKD